MGDDAAKKTVRDEFPEASVSALWEAVELLCPGLRCDRGQGAGDKDCPEHDREGREDPDHWCGACRARRALRVSHEYEEQQKLVMPEKLKVDDPGLSPREGLLAALQAYADAWKLGQPGPFRRAKSQLSQALDKYEFDAVEPWEKLARDLVGTSARANFGPELREGLRRFVGALLEQSRRGGARPYRTRLP